MKKIGWLIPAMGLTVGASALAQSELSLYGTLDTGVLSSQLPNLRANEQLTGGYLPNFWGVKGSEDLGGGLKALFQLESGFNLSNGAYGQFPPSTSFFNRQANVALSSELGTFKVGQQNNVAFLSMLAVDPRGGSNLGSILQYWVMGNGSTSDSNAVSYTSPDLAGLTLRGEYAFGNVAGNNSAGSGTRFGAVYRKNALVLAAGAYAQKDPTTGSQTNKGQVWGAGYQWGALTLKADLARFSGGFQVGPGGSVSPSRTGELNAYGLGGRYDVTPLTALDVGYYSVKDPGNTTRIKAQSLAVGAYHRLSKTLMLYAQVVAIHNQGDASAKYPLLVNTAASSSPAGFMAASGQGHQYNVGVRYSF